MDFNDLVATRAQLFDSEEILRIQAEGDAWNSSKGFLPLAFRYSPKERKEFLNRHISESEIYLFKHKVEAVGLVRLQWNDPVFWGEAGWDPLAGYVHGLTIGSSWHGLGLGSWILSWAEARIRSQGMTCCRLDCMKENLGLCRYYETRGFEERGLVKLGNGWISKRYQKLIG
jgi:ribosomal protein S18 acetylase RimI-like enzyme